MKIKVRQVLAIKFGIRSTIWLETFLRLVSNLNVWIYAKQITIMEGGVILVHPLNSYVILSVSNASAFVCEPIYISEFLSLIR